MLNIEQLVKLHDSGLSVELSDEITPLKGLYDPSFFHIKLFEESLSSKKDRDLTILHEFIHARDDFFNGNLSKVVSNNPYSGDKDNYELATENEAKEVYDNKPVVLNYIKKFFDL